MRLNKFVALATGMSRRSADTAIEDARIHVNGKAPTLGYVVQENDQITLDGKRLQASETITIRLHKPAGYVVSRDGQGSRTVYELLPTKYQQLKPVGRLDKDSSGLLLMTNDGDLANKLTHPSNRKVKVYQARLSRSLQPLHHQMLVDYGVQLEDGPSKFDLLEKMGDSARSWQITMHEGRNRQIRRTFAALGYTVTKLHRTDFGDYHLGKLGAGELEEIT